MGVEETAKVSFNENWLWVDQRGDLHVQKKDSFVVRWLKFLVQILTLNYFDVNAHIRIDRVAKALLRHYKNESDPKKRIYYLQVVENLLDAKAPIRTHRKALAKLHATIQKDLEPEEKNKGARRKLF